MTLEELEARLTAGLQGSGVAGVVAAYLFGSHASNRSHAESDVDVGVLFDRGARPSESARFEARLDLASRLGAAIPGQAVDVVVLNDAPPTLGRRIVTEGRRFFCADPEADHAFVRDVQLRAADLAPFLRRTRRVKLEGLNRP